MKLVDADGEAQPHDGVSRGELLVRGPWIIGAYFRDEEATQEAYDEGGWFRTGDVCTIDADGYLQIVDRRKDVIKSGGEWISSIDVENAAVGHPDVQEAAVIGPAASQMGGAPAAGGGAQGRTAAAEGGAPRFSQERLAKWAVPDDVAFVTEISAHRDGQDPQDPLARDLSGLSAADGVERCQPPATATATGR